jgi:hypothetical protein
MGKYFIFKFKENFLFKSQKIGFQWLKPKFVAYLFQGEALCKQLIARSQSAESGNRLVAVNENKFPTST